MPHARKPKRARNDANHEQNSNKQVKVTEDDDQQVQGWKKTIQSIHISGQKIQIQTKIDKLSKDCNRPSVFLRLDRDNFLEEFKECWQEHIEGFVGLRGSKREKSEKELSMEWRKRVQQIGEKKKNVQVKNNGQTVSENERLAIIQKYRELQAQKKKNKVDE